VPPFNPSSLRAGDCLLYRPRDFIDYAIALKTWTKVSHVEIYDGQGFSLASRNGIGVNRYPARLKDIAAVRRPKEFDPLPASAWFETVKGEGYDWQGLLCFELAVRQGKQDQMFCSEFGTRLYRMAQTEPFDPAWDADRTPPAFFLVSNAFKTVWQDGDLF